MVAADAMMSGGDGQPETLVGVTVTLSGEHAMGETMETGMDGGFAFTGLRAGTYTVTISDFPEDVSFEMVSVEVEVGVGDVGSADFTGHFIRTSAVEGEVIIDGEGLPGVTVTLVGGPADESFTMATDIDGTYRFEDLRPGEYTVSISDFDTRDYEFALTSRDVSVDLDETGTVSFTGVLLRTSGIAGRVSVEGMGLGDIAVTLSGAADASTTTDAGGQYAFAGLAAGDYTVTIAVDDPAYVFDEMSKNRTVGDDDAQILNFEGAHNTSASVTAMLFVDEAAKNDEYDDGEDAFPPAAVLAALQAAQLPAVPVPVTLTGPDVGTVRSGVMDVATGRITFSGLRSGSYSLQVESLSKLLAGLPPELVMVLQDYEYGGQPEGYTIDVAVGEQKTQHLPVDITHQTVHFGVTLKAGDARGMPVPGAMVTLYSGGSEVADGETGETGVASIRFARAGLGMVSAGVAVDGYHVAEGMTDVEWDPKSPQSQSTNSNDIVNLNASFSFRGATIGGEALAGWAIGVTSGDDAVADAPAALGEDGSASFSETVAAGDLPKTYTVAVADDQEGEDADGNELDGGEKYTATTVEHVHNGLSLAGAEPADAGSLVVTYTTQTLVAYVHEEKDQVMGYTGNVLGDDERMSGMVDLELRYVQNGYRHQFAAADSIKSSNKDGVYTFRNVPADKDVIVLADKASDTLDILVLDPDEAVANGFGAQGGAHHTVELCSMKPEGQQRHDGCGTFAFVRTYAVDGQAWKNVVTMQETGDDFARNGDNSFTVSKEGQAGLEVSIDPVEGENLAGANDSWTAEKKSNLQFDFGNMPGGAYTFSVSDDNWMAQRGPLDDPTDDLEASLSPLGAALNIDVTPKTGYIFGHVTDTNTGLPAAGVGVDVNGSTATTDAHGRYIVEGFGPRKGFTPPSSTRARSNDRAVVMALDHGQMVYQTDVAFSANTPVNVNLSVSLSGNIGRISGKVTRVGTGDGVAGVEIQVDDAPPLNATYHTVGRSKVLKLTTDANGDYTAFVPATRAGDQTVKLSAIKDGMFFQPDSLIASAVIGVDLSGYNFTAYDNFNITGRVVDDSDPPKPIVGVMVKARVDATADDDPAVAAYDSAMTGATGQYVLGVRFGSYRVSATSPAYNFAYPGGAAHIDVTVPNDGRPLGDIVATANESYTGLTLLDLSGVTLSYGSGRSRETGFNPEVMDYNRANVYNELGITTVTTAVANDQIVVITPVDTDANPRNGHQVELAEGEVTNVVVTVTDRNDTTNSSTYTVPVYRRTPLVAIAGTVTDGNGAGLAKVDILTTYPGRTPAPAFVDTVETNASGAYTVMVESHTVDAAGAAQMARVTPEKAGYSFTPAMRDVRVHRSSTITGIDFSAGGNATVRGRVVFDGSGLEDVTVSGAGVTTTTNHLGRFTLRNVPLGDQTFTFAKDGYTFDDWRQIVQGDVDLGDISATGSIQPANVAAMRNRAPATRAFDGTVQVSWMAGGAPAITGAAVTYDVEVCVVGFETDGTANAAVTCEPGATEDGWLDATDASSDGVSPDSITVPANSDGGFRVRVEATRADNTATTTVDESATATSAVFSVPAINAQPSLVSAERDIDPTPDNLVVKWNGDRDGVSASETAARIIGAFDFSGTTRWVVLAADAFATGYTAGGATAANPDHEFSFAFESGTLLTDLQVVDPANGTLVDVDGDGTVEAGAGEDDRVDLTADMMNGTFQVRVQAREPGVDVVLDDPDTTEDESADVWKASASASVGAKQ